MINDNLTTIYADYREDGRVQQLTVTGPALSIEAITAIIAVLAQALNAQPVTEGDRSLGSTKVLLNPTKPAPPSSVYLDPNTPIEEIFNGRVNR